MPEFFDAYNVGVIVGNVFWALFCLALYFMLSFGLMNMGRKVGYPWPWLAWIPVADFFVLAALAGTPRKKVAFPFLLLALMCVGASLFSVLFGALAVIARAAYGFSVFLAVVAWMTGIAAYVLYCILAYHIFKRFKPWHATVFTVLSAVFWFLGPIFLFVAGFGTPDQQVSVQPRGSAPPQPNAQSYPPPQGPPNFTPPSGY